MTLTVLTLGHRGKNKRTTQKIKSNFKHIKKKDQKPEAAEDLATCVGRYCSHVLPPLLLLLLLLLLLVLLLLVEALTDFHWLALVGDHLTGVGLPVKHDIDLLTWRHKSPHFPINYQTIQTIPTIRRIIPQF